MEEESQTIEEITIEPTQDEITLTLQLRVPRAQLEAPRDVGFLAGQLLVATPAIESGIFAKSLVYIFEHTAHGAAGLVINKPLETVSYDALFQGQNMNLPRDNTLRQMNVLDGGPCDRHRGFIIHSDDYYRPFCISHHDDIAITTSTAIVNDMAEGNGPHQAALVVGCAIWNGGQVEQEISQNSWITVPATREMIFDTPPELRWTTANRAVGISNMAFYSMAVGHA